MNNLNVDKRALLEELSIPRSSSPSPAGQRSFALPLATVVLLLAAAGAAVWFFVTDSQLVDRDTLADRDYVVLQTSLVRLEEPSTLSAGGVVLEAAGYVVARRQAAVSSKTTGRVDEILIEEGMMVEAGQLLARLDDSSQRAEFDLAVARQSEARLAVNEKQVLLAQARRDLARIEKLAARGTVSQSTLERSATEVTALTSTIARLQQAAKVAARDVDVKRQSLSDTEIRAPFSGIVTTKSAQPGEMISPIAMGGSFARTGICTIVDMNSLEVEVDINEAFIDRIRQGQPAEIVLNSYSEKVFPAEVAAIIPAADRNKATIRVRIALLEADPRILPGMGVSVSFVDKAATNPADTTSERLFVPDNAVVREGGNASVWVVSGGEITRRDISIIETSGPHSQVSLGLAAGEWVVTGLNGELHAYLSEGGAFLLAQQEGNSL